MIFINLSYFDTILGPQTLLTVPFKPEEDIEECTNSLLNISEFIDLKFFVYVSSEKFKTSNIYTRIPSEWARGKMEMLLISIILVNEEFNRLHLFEEILENIVGAINKIDDAYKAFHVRETERPDFNEITFKKEIIMKRLEGFIPEINHIIETTKKIPLNSEVIETEENLQDEFVILQKKETILEAAKKLASHPRILIGCVIEDNKPIGIVDEDDVINKVILKGKDPISVKVEQIMTTNIIKVDANDPIDDVIDLMLDNEIKAVPILQNNEFYGVFTISDAASHHRTILELIGEQLQDLSESKLEYIKQLKVKLWSYIRNIQRNRKLLDIQKEQ